VNSFIGHKIMVLALSLITKRTIAVVIAWIPAGNLTQI